MARRSEVMKLPTDVREFVDAQLRGAVYGNYDGLSKQLLKRGYNVSKSALHRYGVALRQVDAANGRQDVQVAAVSIENSAVAVGRRDGLLLELGRLAHRQAEILTEIARLDSGSSH